MKWHRRTHQGSWILRNVSKISLKDVPDDVTEDTPKEDTGFWLNEWSKDDNDDQIVRTYKEPRDNIPNDDMWWRNWRWLGVRILIDDLVVTYLMMILRVFIIYYRADARQYEWLGIKIRNSIFCILYVTEIKRVHKDV